MFCSCPGLRPQPAVLVALQALPGLKTAILNEFWHADRPHAKRPPNGLRRPMPANNYAIQGRTRWLKCFFSAWPNRYFGYKRITGHDDWTIYSWCIGEGSWENSFSLYVLNEQTSTRKIQVSNANISYVLMSVNLWSYPKVWARCDVDVHWCRGL